MNNNEDIDIKIFGNKDLESETDTLIRVVEAMKRQHANGNSDKAKKLGEKIAHLIFNPENIDDADFQKILNQYRDNEKVFFQIKMLLTFVAESTIHYVLDKVSLSSIAVNALYDELIKMDEEFYDNITNAFSFYYLALRKGNDVVSRIGRRFAMLCEDQKNENLCSVGSTIYVDVAVIINKEIEKAEFSE